MFQSSDHIPKDRKNGYPSQFLDNLMCPTNVDEVPFLEMDSDSFLHTLQNSNPRFTKTFGNNGSSSF